MTGNPISWQDADSLAGAIFVARDALDKLVTAAPGQSRPVISFQDIYSYATDSSMTPDPEFTHALATDARAQEDLRCLLARVAPYRQVTRAAASSGAVTLRSGTGFEMTLRESRADRDQLYLIIKLANAGLPAPGTLFVIGEDEGCRKVSLPRPTDGVIQLLLSAASDLAGALCNPKTDVFLR